MPPRSREVRLGDDTYTLVPQRHAYLQRRIASVIDSLQGSDVEGAGGIMELVGARLYDVLKAFIPDLMPRWKFEGYASAGAQQAQDYDEEGDRSPSYAEQFDAIEAALEVNGLNRLSALGKVVSPELVRALIAEQVANMATQQRRSSSSPSRSGEPPSANGTPTSPTSDTRPDGRTHESRDSSTLELDAVGASAEN